MPDREPSATLADRGARDTTLAGGAVNTSAIILAALLCAQSGLARAREALRQGDYYGAWNAIALEPEDLDRAQGVAEILYEAGDPAGALNAARAGLAIDPKRIELIYCAAGAAIWLEDGLRAIAYSERLLGAAQTIADGECRSGWERMAQSYVAKSQSLMMRERVLDRALRRAQMLAGFSNIGVVVIVLLCAVRVGRGGRFRR